MKRKANNKRLCLFSSLNIKPSCRRMPASSAAKLLVVRQMLTTSPEPIEGLDSGFRRNDCKGFTLVEIIIVSGIMAIAIVGLLQLLIYCSFLSETSNNLTAAFGEAKGKLEEIKNRPFSAIVTDYSNGATPGDTFSLNQLDGMGAVIIDSSNTSLLKVKTVVCWRDQNNRVIGEDTNLNGALNSAEDTNGNGELDSPASMTTLIAYQ